MSSKPLNSSCRICGSQDPKHEERDHPFTLAGMGGDQPMAFVIDLQRWYEDGSRKAAIMAFAMMDIKRCFPGKNFTVQPSRFMLTKAGENSVHESHVASYIVFEV